MIAGFAASLVFWAGLLWAVNVISAPVMGLCILAGWGLFLWLAAHPPSPLA